jgi:hypothetical protein
MVRSFGSRSIDLLRRDSWDQAIPFGRATDGPMPSMYPPARVDFAGVGRERRTSIRTAVGLRDVVKVDPASGRVPTRAFPRVNPAGRPGWSG